MSFPAKWQPGRNIHLKSVPNRAAISLTHASAAGFGCSGHFLQLFSSLSYISLIGKVPVTDKTVTACQVQWMTA